MAKTKSARIVTRKHVARLERERRQARLITFIAIGVITVVVLLIAYGILNDTVLVNSKPVLTVNGETVTVGEFRVRVRAKRQEFIDQYIQYSQFYQMLGMDPYGDESLANALDNIQQQLNAPVYIGSLVIQQMTDEILIRQFAEQNGIVVTEEEVQRAIHDAFSYYPDGTPTPAPTNTPYAEPTLSAAQLDLATATPTREPSPTPTEGPTPTITPTRTPPPDLTPLPTSTPYTQEGFENTYQEALARFSEFGMGDAQFRKIYFENRLYRQRVMDLVTADVAHEAEQVWARHILVADEEAALSIRDQLLGGLDFADLAAEYSLDTSNKDAGGDLGWFGRGRMVTEFEEAAFALEIGEISQPVQTSFGWHIIQVVGHETLPLSESEYQDAVEAAFEAWLDEQSAAAEIVTAENWADLVPDKPTLEEAFQKLDATQTALAPTFEAQQQTQDAGLLLIPTATP